MSFLKPIPGITIIPQVLEGLVRVPGGADIKEFSAGIHGYYTTSDGSEYIDISTAGKNTVEEAVEAWNTFVETIGG